jgi:CheY-like chemotaxis protein
MATLRADTPHLPHAAAREGHPAIITPSCYTTSPALLYRKFNGWRPRASVNFRGMNERKNKNDLTLRKITKAPLVLIVEPDSSNQLALVGLLKKLGLQSTVVTNLEAARKSLATTTPRIMILNLKLPDGNGIGLLAEIRRAKQPITVAVVAALTQQLNLNELMALKPNAVFGNPVDVDDFEDWLVKQNSNSP